MAYVPSRFLDSHIPGQYGPRGFEGDGFVDVLTRVESMADDTRKTGQDQSDEEAALSARLERLGNRLHQVSRTSETAPDSRPAGADASAMARGFRLSTELVAGVLVGAGIGWLLDRWLGISPWGLIVFLLLGFAAGVLNVMRAAGVVRENQ